MGHVLDQIRNIQTPNTDTEPTTINVTEPVTQLCDQQANNEDEALAPE